MASEESMARAFTGAAPPNWDIRREPVHGSPNRKYHAESPNGRWRLETHGEPTQGWVVQLYRNGEFVEGVNAYNPTDVAGAVKGLFERHIGHHRFEQDPGMFDQLF